MTREQLLESTPGLIEMEKEGTIDIDMLLAINKDEKEKAQKEHEAFEKKQGENRRRAYLLKKGTKTSDGKLWFNMDTAQMFVIAVTTLKNGESLLWRDVNRETVEIPYEDAKTYAKEIRITLQKFYGLTK